MCVCPEYGLWRWTPRLLQLRLEQAGGACDFIPLEDSVQGHISQNDLDRPFRECSLQYCAVLGDVICSASDEAKEASL